MLGKRTLKPLLWIQETFPGLNLFNKLLLGSTHWDCQSLGKQRWETQFLPLGSLWSIGKILKKFTKISKESPTQLNNYS